MNFRRFMSDMARLLPSRSAPAQSAYHTLNLPERGTGRYRPKQRVLPIHARLRASLAELDEGVFTEGHELDRKTERQVPKEVIGRRLSQEEAKRLLAKFE
jgi:hypothetical protein